MKGIGDLKTRTIDPGLGIVVFNGIVTLVVTAFTLGSFAKRSWPQARLLQAGMILLSLYFIAHWTDVMARHYRIVVSYNYIFASDTFNILKALSECFITGGGMLLICRFSQLGKEPFYGLIAPISLLLFFAIYHICLLFSLSLTWLSFADLEVINKVAKARNAFEIAYTALQFFILYGGCFYVIDDDTQILEYEDQEVYAKVAVIPLFARSFCEVVIVGQLDRWPTHLPKILRARDVCYALFSMILIIPLCFAVLPINRLDPLESEDRIAREEVMAWLNDHIISSSENGKKTAPTIVSLLETLEGILKPPTESRSTRSTTSTGSTSDRASIINRIKIDEIKRLKELYKDWEPIYKWQGEPYNSSLEHEAEKDEITYL